MAYPPPPYKDAVCGQPVAGEAITGTWWAYPARGTLTLNGRPPILSGVGVIVSVNRGVLTLSARTTNLNASSTIPVGRAVLTLNGRIARFVGQDWLYPIDCDELDLAAADCVDMTLVVAGTTTLDLAPLDCR
jgi:hypothetical protein